MTLEGYIKLLRRYWTLFLACVVVGLVVAGAVFSVKPPVYTAKSIIYISGLGGDTPITAYNGTQNALLRMKSYTQLVSSIRVASDVVARLGLHESPEKLVKQITAQSTSDSLVLNVAVTASSPTEAARMANTVDDVFKDLVEQLETSSTGVRAVEALIVQPATASAKPSSLGLSTMLALGLASGLVAGLGACIARDRIDGLAERGQQGKNRVLASPTSATNILADPPEDRANAYQHHHTDER